MFFPLNTSSFFTSPRFPPLPFDAVSTYSKRTFEPLSLNFFSPQSLIDLPQRELIHSLPNYILLPHKSSY